MARRRCVLLFVAVLCLSMLLSLDGARLPDQSDLESARLQNLSDAVIPDVGLLNETLSRNQTEEEIKEQQFLEMQLEKLRASQGIGGGEPESLFGLPWIKNRAIIARQFLKHHNKVRMEVGEVPLRWSRQLARYARHFADTQRGICKLQHSYGPYGENVFMGPAGLAWKASDAVNLWVSESEYYNRTTNSCEPDKICGHYKQVVWRGSLRVGCARVNCYSGGVFITCNYDPPGNYINESPFE